MYKHKSIAVVVPCYNEEKQINNVVKTMPAFVDKIIIVDDKSQDQTVVVVNGLKNKKTVLLKHSKNQGVGVAVATGYKWCRDNNIDIVAVMDGDGQMLSKDLIAIITPIVEERAD